MEVCVRSHSGNYHLNNSHQVNLNCLDKRLQDLRTFAYEYVKQIVAKSAELSRNHYDCSEKAINKSSISSNEQHQRRKPSLLKDPATKRLISDAAIQINARLKLGDNPAIIKQPNRQIKTPLASVSDKTNVKSTTKKTTFQQDQPSRLISNPIESDYMEQDYTKMSNDYQDSSLASNSSQKGQQATGRPGIGGLHQRLNWHLLVSCFSVCLPESFVDSMRKQTENNVGPSAV